MLITARLLGCGLEHLCGPPLQEKTDRGETEGEEWERGGVVGPQGCSERSPQFFHHCRRHCHSVVLLLSSAKGQREADVRCGCVEDEKRNGAEKAGRGQGGCVGLAIRGACWQGRREGRWEEPVVQTCGRLPPPPQPASAPQPSSPPLCVWCLFTSLFNHGAVPVVDWHKMTAA